MALFDNRRSLQIRLQDCNVALSQRFEDRVAGYLHSGKTVWRRLRRVRIDLTAVENTQIVLCHNYLLGMTFQNSAIFIVDKHRKSLVKYVFLDRLKSAKIGLALQTL